MKLKGSMQKLEISIFQNFSENKLKTITIFEVLFYFDQQLVFINCIYYDILICLVTIFYFHKI